MEPRIQYAKTSDGVSIAFYAIGEGPPLVSVSLPLAHLQFEWQNEQTRLIYETAARTWTFVRYDSRGFGLSDRGISDFRLAGMVRDLEAVADHLQLGTFILFADSIAVPIAIAYCAQHPERASRLILWQGSARGGDMTNEQFDTLVTLAETNWELTSESMLHAIRGWGSGEDAHEGAALLRESITPDAFRAFITQIREWDVTSEAERVSAPTLVLHPPKHRFFSVEMGRRLAALIPDARLVLADGFGEPVALAAIAEFLGQAPATRLPQDTRATSSFRTILFTDVVENTALLRRIGDEAWRAVMREHEEIVRAALKEHGGTEISTSGDSFFASFGSSVRALQCAVEMQRAFVRRSETAEHPVEVRIGLNAGEPIEEGTDMMGTAVTMAARIMSQAVAGEILVSDVVRQLVAGKGFFFADRGEFVAKGFEEPVRVWAVMEGE